MIVIVTISALFKEIQTQHILIYFSLDLLNLKIKKTCFKTFQITKNNIKHRCKNYCKCLDLLGTQKDKQNM